MTEVPVIVTTTPANKLSKRILSLFQTNNRKPSRYRTGLPGSRQSENKSDLNSRRRLSSFISKNERNTFRDVTKPVTSTSPPSTTRDTPATEQTVRIVPRIRPVKLSPKTRFRPSIAKDGEEADKAEEDLEVSVRKESSVTSITSSVRVSVREETSFVPGISFIFAIQTFPKISTISSDERPFSNGRGGDQFEKADSEEEEVESDYLTRIREKVELSEKTSSTTARPRAKPIKCHTGSEGVDLQGLTIMICRGE